MEIKSKFDHFNINVTNLERSIAFYEQALGLKEHHRKESSDGSFTLVYLTDGSTGFLLELTCLKEHPQAYELGENESHLCFRVAGDYDAIRQYHKENGWVCFENTAMGLYFINDPDDYWIEILPAKDAKCPPDEKPVIPIKDVSNLYLAALARMKRIAAFTSLICAGNLASLLER